MMRNLIVFVLVVALGGEGLSACKRAEEKNPATQAKQEESQEDKTENAAPSPLLEEKQKTGEQKDHWPGEERPAERPRRNRFAQRLRVTTPVQTLRVGQVVIIPVVVRNLSSEPWPVDNSPSGAPPVKLWYHWLDGSGTRRALPVDSMSPDAASGENPRRRPRLPRSTSVLSARGKVVEFGGIRTPLPQEVGPRQSVTLNATVKAPERPGEFVLRLTMLREGEDSFENHGGTPLDLFVTVTQ